MKTSSDIKKIHINTSKGYEVLIGKNLLSSSGEKIKEIISPCKVAVITDDIVEPLYFCVLEKSLKDCGFSVCKFIVKNGEQSKNLIVYGEILDFLAENEITRTDLIIALGGGVIGDMAGFASATFLRGIKYIQIPTTLLSQIDSSVGGKTAIDLKKGKNLVGAFYQPSLVIIDTLTLGSLTEEIFNDGMGEVVKYAILDEKIFSILEKGQFLIEDLVYNCVDYKRKIVEADEFESGNRKLLNFGHTPAHGIEALSNFTITHGRAVAMGVKIMIDNSLAHGLITKKEHQRMISVIEGCVKDTACPFEMDKILSFALSDKKRSGDFISVMMAHGVGEVKEHKIKVSKLREFIK